MPVSITASLVGVSTPKAVQVVVSGLTPGVPFEVRGSWSGGDWRVRAGRGVATASQLVLNDVHTPVNTVITYAVVHGEEAAASPPIVVDYQGKYLVQSLDGQRSAAFQWIDNGDPRDMHVRTAVFDIPGRARPVTRFDVVGGESGEWVVNTTGTQTEALRALIQAGAPLMVRTDGKVRDIAAVDYIHVTSAQRALTGALINEGDTRAWSLGFELVDDPEPDTLVAASTWLDFDGSHDGLTWGTFDLEWESLTWDDFDVTDWATRVSLIGAVFGFGFGPYGTYPYGL